MKIQGPTQSQVNLYKDNTQKQPEKHTSKKRTDQLEISQAAQHLQKSNPAERMRAQYVNQIKQSYEAGTYKVHPEKVANKMINYWSNVK